MGSQRMLTPRPRWRGGAIHWRATVSRLLHPPIRKARTASRDPACTLRSQGCRVGELEPEENAMEQSEKADAIIRDHVGWSVAAGLIPIPIGDVLAVTGIQLDMVGKLAETYEQRFSPNLAKGLITSLTGQAIARIGASLVKAIPVIGTMVGVPAQMALAGASTYAVGHLFKSHFAAGGTLDTFNPERARAAYEKCVEKGRAVVTELRRDSEASPSVESVAGTLAKLAQLRDAGELTRAEFDRLKSKLVEHAG